MTQRDHGKALWDNPRLCEMHLHEPRPYAESEGAAPPQRPTKKTSVWTGTKYAPWSAGRGIPGRQGTKTSTGDGYNGRGSSPVDTPLPTEVPVGVRARTARAERRCATRCQTRMRIRLLAR